MGAIGTERLGVYGCGADRFGPMIISCNGILYLYIFLYIYSTIIVARPGSMITLNGI